MELTALVFVFKKGSFVKLSGQMRKKELYGTGGLRGGKSRPAQDL